MAKLASVAAKIKKIGIPVAVFFVIAFLGTLIYFRLFPTSTTQEIPRPPIQSLPVSTNTFDTSSIIVEGSYPASLPVFQTSTPSSLLENAPSLAATFNFPQNPQELTDKTEGKTLIYSKDKSSLIIKEEFLSFINLPSNNLTPGLNVQNSESIAQNLITSLNPAAALTSPQISLTKELENLQPTTLPQEAIFINFNYSYSLSSLPLIMPTTPISITLDSQGNLINLSYRQFTPPTSLNQFPVIPFEKALDNLVSKKEGVISIQEGEEAFKVSTLEIVILKKAYLAYYLPAKTPQTLQPFWIFEGNAQKDGSTIEVVYAQPAIEEKFFQKPN